MTSDKKQGIWLTLIALSTLCGLIIRVILTEKPWDLLSYFTIQSNIIVFLYASATVAYMVACVNRPKFWHQLGGFVTLIISITGIVYNTMLADWSHLSALDGYANIQVHIITPLLMIFYFLFVSAKIIIPYKVIGYWLGYPLLYFAGSLIRGAKDGWYPYWFINVNQLGVSKLALIAITLLAVFAALSFILIFVNNKIKKS